MRQKDDEDFAEVVADETLVNTSDATVKRINWERACYDRACARATAQLNKLISSYDANFTHRVGLILQNVDAKLPPLPPQFLENAELS